MFEGGMGGVRGGGVVFLSFFFGGGGGGLEGEWEGRLGKMVGLRWDGMGWGVILKGWMVFFTVPLRCYFHGSVGQKASWLRENGARERTREQ